MAFYPLSGSRSRQSIESAYELFKLVEENNPDIHNAYFKERSKRASIVREDQTLIFLLFIFLVQ